MTSTTESAVKALKPFAAWADDVDRHDVADGAVTTDDVVIGGMYPVRITAGDVRRARSVLTAQPASPAASEVRDAVARALLPHLQALIDRALCPPHVIRPDQITADICAAVEAALASTRGGQGTGDVSEAFLKVCEALGIQATASAHLDAAAIKARADRTAASPPDPSAREAQLATERTQQAERALERDRSLVAQHLGNIQHVMEGYSWLREACRGSYAYDDDRYQREFGNALDALDEALKPLRRIARDWSNCPTDAGEIKAARTPLTAPQPDPSAREPLAAHFATKADITAEDMAWAEGTALSVARDPPDVREALAVRASAIEECARLATSFLVGDPANGVPLRNPMAHEIADRIRALSPAPGLPASGEGSD